MNICQALQKCLAILDSEDIMKPSQSITTKSIYDQANDQYDTIHSKRGIDADLEKLKTTPVSDVFKKAWAQDDWGLVTVWTIFKGDTIRFVIEHNNRGYSCRAWLNERPCYALDGMLSADGKLYSLFGE
jgi:hypothetical protein